MEKKKGLGLCFFGGLKFIWSFWSWMWNLNTERWEYEMSDRKKHGANGIATEM